MDSPTQLYLHDIAVLPEVQKKCIINSISYSNHENIN